MLKRVVLRRMGTLNLPAFLALLCRVPLSWFFEDKPNPMYFITGRYEIRG